MIDRDGRTDRLWGIVTLLGWGVISALLFVRGWRFWRHANPDLAMISVAASVVGFLLTLIVVALPLRIFLNLARPERRRARLGETALCLFTLLALVNMVIAMVVSYPRDW